MIIIDRKNLDSVYDLKEINPEVEWVFLHFMNYSDEVLYFLSGNRLEALISIGDLFKYLEGNSKDLLNRNFTQIDGVNDEAAIIFFQLHPTVHELPIVDRNGDFVGVCFSGSKNSERVIQNFRRHAERLFFKFTEYQKKECAKFLQKCLAKIFLIELPREEEVLVKLNDEDREEFLSKSGKSPMEILLQMTEEEAEIYWGDIYQPNISREFVDAFKNVETELRNGVTLFSNRADNRFFTFKNGIRTIDNVPGNTAGRIYMVGPCTILGAYVANDQTIEYFLQKQLNENQMRYEVVNWGSLGPDREFQHLLTEAIGEDDIIVIAVADKVLTSILKSAKNVQYLGNLADIFEHIDHLVPCVLDTFRHVNYKINSIIAEYLYKTIGPYLKTKFLLNLKQTVAFQDYYISWEIYCYYKKYALENSLGNLEGIVGSIVMNCNPYTKGHRYLIEYAASVVDTLIVFVVEEDASYFSFADRFEMVKRGTNDIANVKVVPSGKYNISKSTFAQYFEKDNDIKQVKSMEYDIHIFGEVIAKIMNISYRFAGEEPTDIVTARYNETMKKILPNYGISFIEIPRIKNNKNDIVSASKVRALLQKGNWEEIHDFLPASSLDYLKTKYM